MSLDNLFGLPAHPLVVHAAVVLLPIAAIATVVVAAVPRWRRPYALLAFVVALAAAGAIWLAQESGRVARGTCRRNRPRRAPHRTRRAGPAVGDRRRRRRRCRARGRPIPIPAGEDTHPCHDDQPGRRGHRSPAAGRRGPSPRSDTQAPRQPGTTSRPPTVIDGCRGAPQSVPRPGSRRSHRRHRRPTSHRMTGRTPTVADQHRMTRASGPGKSPVRPMPRLRRAGHRERSRPRAVHRVDGRPVARRDLRPHRRLPHRPPAALALTSRARRPRDVRDP